MEPIFIEDNFEDNALIILADSMPMNLMFYGKGEDGVQREVGKFYFDEKTFEMKYEGAVDEAAEIFTKMICRMFEMEMARIAGKH